MLRSIHTQLALAALACVLAACGGGSGGAEAVSSSAAAGPPPVIDNPATITGRVTLQGAAPARQAIKTLSDPNCAKSGHPEPTTETFVVGDSGAFANVFVYVKDGLGGRKFPPPAAAVVLQQQGCSYVPHVIGIQVGQKLEIVNDDPTIHNVHALAKTNREFNFGQALKGIRTTRTFTAPEVLLPFKCDVHGWMYAYAGVVDHPYFAVSGADGSFTIGNLPAGTYTIEAVHEKLGAQTQSVTVGANESKPVSFTFKMG